MNIVLVVVVVMVLYPFVTEAIDEANHFSPNPVLLKSNADCPGMAKMVKVAAKVIKCGSR